MSELIRELERSVINAAREAYTTAGKTEKALAEHRLATVTGSLLAHEEVAKNAPRSPLQVPPVYQQKLPELMAGNAVRLGDASLIVRCALYSEAAYRLRQMIDLTTLETATADKRAETTANTTAAPGPAADDAREETR